MSGGVASAVADLIVTSGADGHIEHFTDVGYVVVGTTLIKMWLMTRIDRQLRAKV